MCSAVKKCIIFHFFLLCVYHAVCSETNYKRIFQSEFERALDFHRRFHNYLAPTTVTHKTTTKTNPIEWASKRKKEVILNKFYKSFAAILRSLDDEDLLTMVQAADEEIGDGDDEKRVLLQRTFAKDPFILELTTPTSIRNLDLDTPEYYGFVHEINEYYRNKFAHQKQLKQLYRNLTNIFVRELEREFNSKENFKKTSDRHLHLGTKHSLVDIVSNAVAIFKSHPSLDDRTKEQIHFTLKTLWNDLKENGEGETEEYIEKASKNFKTKHQSIFRYSLRDLLNILNFMMESEVWQRTRLLKDNNRKRKSKLRDTSSPSPQFLEFYNINSPPSWRKKSHRKRRQKKEYKKFRADKERFLVHLLSSEETTTHKSERRATNWVKFLRSDKRPNSALVLWDNSANVDVVGKTWRHRQDEADDDSSKNDETTPEPDTTIPYMRYNTRRKQKYKHPINKYTQKQRIGTKRPVGYNKMKFKKLKVKLLRKSTPRNARKGRIRKYLNKRNRFTIKSTLSREEKQQSKLPLGPRHLPKAPRKLRYFSINRTAKIKPVNTRYRVASNEEGMSIEDRNKSVLKNKKPSKKPVKLRTRSDSDSDGMSIEVNKYDFVNITTKQANVKVITTVTPNNTVIPITITQTSETVNTPIDDQEDMSLEFYSITPMNTAVSNKTVMSTVTSKAKRKKTIRPKSRSKIKTNETIEEVGLKFLKNLHSHINDEESQSTSDESPYYVPVPESNYHQTKEKTHNKTSDYLSLGGKIIKLNETIEDITTVEPFEISAANFSFILANLIKESERRDNLREENANLRRDDNSTIDFETDETIMNTTLNAQNITKAIETKVANNETKDSNTTESSSEELVNVFSNINKVILAENISNIATMHLSTTTPVPTTPLLNLIQNLLKNSDQVVKLIMRSDDKEENYSLTQKIVDIKTPTLEFQVVDASTQNLEHLTVTQADNISNTTRNENSIFTVNKLLTISEMKSEELPSNATMPPDSTNIDESTSSEYFEK